MDNEGLLEEIIETLEILESTRDKLYKDYSELPAILELGIDSSFPPILIFSSDWHLGSIYTDYRSLLRMLKMILETKNAYLVIVGDAIDNFEHPKLSYTTVNSVLVTPELQRELLTKILNALVSQNKLLAVVLGNHESFTGSYPYASILLSQAKIFYNRVFLKLKVEDQVYRIALVHRSRYNSFLNPIHSSFRELIVNYNDCDIIVTSHTHVPALGVIHYPRENQLIDRVLIKTGAYKFDKYMLNFSSSKVDTTFSTPAVVLSRRRRKIIPFPRAEDALALGELLILLE